MIGIIRIAVIIFFILTVIYVSLSLVSRIQKRDKLKAEYDERNADAEHAISKADYIADGLAEHNKQTRRKLAFKVYTFPAIIAAILLYLAHVS